MTEYLINIALIIIFGVMFLYTNQTKENKKAYCIICAVQWILLSGLRDWSVGADTMNYYDWFEEVKTMSWPTVIKNCWDYLFNGLVAKDPGYNLVQKIFQIFFDDYQMWLIAIAALFTGLMARWIYKYSSMPEISFLLYSVLFYSFYALTGHRQTIATALIFFLGYEYAKKKQFWKFVIVAFIAFMIHKSSLVFILFYIVANINLSFFYVFAVLILIVIMAIFGQELYVPIASFLGFMDEDVLNNEYNASTYATVLMLLCVIALAMYPWISKKRTDAKNIYNMLFLTMGSTVLVFHNQSFMRIQQYFSLIIMVVVPEMIRVVDKNYRIFVYLFIVIFLISYIVRQNPEYLFFFM